MMLKRVAIPFSNSRDSPRSSSFGGAGQAHSFLVSKEIIQRIITCKPTSPVADCIIHTLRRSVVFLSQSECHTFCSRATYKSGLDCLGIRIHSKILKCLIIQFKDEEDFNYNLKWGLTHSITLYLPFQRGHVPAGPILKHAIALRGWGD